LGRAQLRAVTGRVEPKAVADRVFQAVHAALLAGHDTEINAHIEGRFKRE
jgi:hypothetical protein